MSLSELKLRVGAMAFTSVLRLVCWYLTLTRHWPKTAVGDAGDRAWRDDAIVVTVQDGVFDCGGERGKPQPRWRFKRTIRQPTTTGNLELKNP